MKLGSIIRQSIKKADFFKTSQLLRYKGEPDYRTVFGGIVSSALIILLVTMFYLRLKSCVQKEDVNSIEKKIINQIPSSYTIETYPRGTFMLAISIGPVSLTEEKKYFNVTMDSIVSIWDYDKLQWNTTVNTTFLEKCTREHWKLLPRMEKQYDSWGLDQMLCLPMNSAFELQGDQFSDVSKKINIKVKPCNSSASLGTICASQSQLDQIFGSKQSIEARIFMINPNVNPSTLNYIQYTFNYGNRLFFTKEEGSTGTIYVQDYQIETDESIFPITIKKTDTGATFSTAIIPQTHQRADNDSIYCQFNIFKSEVSKKYQRSFQKFDQLLAFIGGLFGTLTMFLLIVNSYNTFAYQISLGSALFKPQNQNQMRTFRKYNFLSFLLQIIHTVLNFFGCNPQWKSTIEYKKCQKEMEKQLDIQYILDRLTYLQTATSTLLEDYQMKGLHLKGKLTLKEAKNRRRAFKLKKGIRQVQKSMRKKFCVEQPSADFSFLNKFSTSNQNTETKEPNTSSLFFRNNKVQPQIEFENKEIMAFEQNQVQQSDSSTDGEQFSRNTDDNQVMGVLNRLREESQSGDKLSQKIWQITNNAIVNIIPDLLTKGNDLFFNLNLESSNGSSLRSPKFSDIMSPTDSIAQEQVNPDPDPVVKNPFKVTKNRLRASRFSKNK